MVSGVKKGECTGCGACATVCPVKCIYMEYDKEGFLYPHFVAEKCINCNLCQKVCHLNKHVNTVINRKAYFAKTLDKEILFKSSSGGIFSVIAEVVINQGGKVYGATYDDYYNVVHKGVSVRESIAILRKSKYVQSNMIECFEEIKKEIKNDRFVLFCGVPCQIAALKSYLSKMTDKLLTIDLICSGCPSPGVWRSYMEILVEQYQSAIKSIDFRDKSNGWNNFSLKIEFENGNIYKKVHSDDLFLRAFIYKLINRPCCYKCKYIRGKNVADITLGDLWGVKEITGTYENDGNSVVVVNTKKGEQLLQQVKKTCFTTEVDIKKVVRYNSPLINYYIPNIHRKRFFKYFASGVNINDAFGKCNKYNLIERIIFKIIYLYQKLKDLYIISRMR